jgi:hypothetical protein
MKSSISSATTRPSLYNARKVGCSDTSDIYCSPWDRFGYHTSAWIEHAEVLATPVVDLNLSMKIVPLVKTLEIIATPPSTAMHETKVLA